MLLNRSTTFDNTSLIRPAIGSRIETYTPERKAEFLLNNAVSSQDYADARKEVRKVGLDPDTISRGAARGGVGVDKGFSGSYFPPPTAPLTIC